MNMEELDSLIQEIAEQLKSLPELEKELTKQQRSQKIVRQLQLETLARVKAAKEKGNLQQEIKASMDYAILTRYGEKHPFLMNFIKSQTGWYGF